MEIFYYNVIKNKKMNELMNGWTDEWMNEKFYVQMN